MFRAVSMNDSPLERLDVLAVKSWVSAESRLAARLKLVRVRVEFSKKRLKTIFPWRVPIFLRSRRETLSISSAVSRIAVMSSADRPSSPSKCLRSQAGADGGGTVKAGAGGVAVDTAGLLAGQGDGGQRRGAAGWRTICSTGST